MCGELQTKIKHGFHIVAFWQFLAPSLTCCPRVFSRGLAAKSVQQYYLDSLRQKILGKKRSDLHHSISRVAKDLPLPKSADNSLARAFPAFFCTIVEDPFGNCHESLNMKLKDITNWNFTKKQKTKQLKQNMNQSNENIYWYFITIELQFQDDSSCFIMNHQESWAARDAWEHKKQSSVITNWYGSWFLYHPVVHPLCVYFGIV